MTKRALVIRTAGDPALAGAIVSGLVKVDPEMERKAALYDVSRNRDSKYWRHKSKRARRKYTFKRPGKVSGWLMGLWACVYLMIFRATGGGCE